MIIFEIPKDFALLNKITQLCNEHKSTYRNTPYIQRLLTISMFPVAFRAAPAIEAKISYIRFTFHYSIKEC